MKEYIISDIDADILVDVICFGLVHMSTQLTESVINGNDEATSYWDNMLNKVIPLLNTLNDIRKEV